ncbi:hypothetical protein GI582_23655 [Sulfitobacter sp. BDSS02]|nr:hypothetical protein [Sulfitobacter sp. BDSS02]MBR9852089.1 hypothetical protein [Paracoccaceae bacterium]
MICFVWLGKDAEWFRDLCEALEAEDLAMQDRRRVLTSLDMEGGNDVCQSIGDWSEAGTLPDAEGFPHVSTFLDELPYIARVSPERLLALDSYTAWGVDYRADKIRKEFRKNGLHLP